MEEKIRELQNGNGERHVNGGGVGVDGGDEFGDGDIDDEAMLDLGL